MSRKKIRVLVAKPGLDGHDRGAKVVAGGIIPGEDVPALEKIGIRAVFGPGARTPDIVAAVRRLVTGE